MSSNPFRKKALEAIDTTRVQSPVKSSLRSDSPLGGDGAILDKPRTVKKVRVLSPPPLSPDSPEWPANVSRSGYAESLYRDPFGVSWSTDESDPDTPATAPAPAPPAVVPTGNAASPANPFSKTLQAPEDSEHLENQRKSEGAALKAGNLARQSLNVDSFKRLLLTGKVNDTEPLLATDSPASNDSAAKRAAPANNLHAGGTTAEGSEEEEESSNSETSSADNSDNHARPVSTTSPDGHSGKEKKAPPPPPSSRRGRSLRDDGSDALGIGLPTDVNKPLPPSPVRTSVDDGADSPFDRESAGRVPEQPPGREPDAGAAEPQRDSATQPSGGKKSAPAPPPRRGHARGESRGHLPAAESTPSRRRGDEVPVGTSGDETPTRSDEPRHAGHAPTPPPPRRPHAASRQITPTSSQVTSVPPSPTPQSDSDHSAPLDASAATAHDEAHPAGSKLVSPPPRPPTRKPSVKRPASVISVEGLSRRVSVESRARDGPARPPPPPPRQRGSSSGSLDALPRRTSGEAASAHSGQRLLVSSSGGTATLGEEQAPDPGKGDDILADLDALQREVDALRGQIG
ncbi:hypothetical protein HRG_005069 [Hirsutella rhossiliensis]|uniref:Uncharacterized protein n=1 Tax=Hirsutella rhossiliensis TaxID=111463 RepID=A0A9P8SL07_9HYPO|nr:uncharacterized protein HRG_05069 [Hirsutella rhossiliensis]KAH0964641.1 hypothetical protein HRG_05069 [Hirsutella rhossiliensis]